jgi:proliferating cell nuclear antigen
MTADDEHKDCIVFFKTSQVVQLKTLMDVLKDLLTEVNLRFDDKGIKIISLDPGRMGMVHASICHLESYFCSKTPFYAGIFVGYLYKILRSVNTSHHLECRVREGDPKIMELVVSNGDKRTQTVHRLKLLDLDVEEINIPNVDFEFVISMPSAEFQKYIKELSHISNLVTIRGSGKLIQFICNGDLGETCIEISPTPSGLNWIHKDSVKETFEGTYFLKYLERFSRGQVDSTVEVYFKQDYPLIMRYEMTIGSLRFCVAPINNKE